MATNQEAREQIFREFSIVQGRIANPGKFEGEMCYVPYYWDLAMEGFADRDNRETFSFDLDASDRETWPELPKRKRTLKLYERSDGFVCEV